MDISVAAPLTFGDTFTLPVTGDLVWTIRDSRPTFAHLLPRQHEVGLRHTAYAKCETDQGAFFVPGEGWSVPSIERGREVLIAQLGELDVNLPEKSAAAWSEDYCRMLGRETRTEVNGVIALVDIWTEGTDIDPAPLKAHVAAIAAVRAADDDDDGWLYHTVYQATLGRLRK